MAASATYQVTPPEQFNFSHPEEWPKWALRFERFHKASGLKEKDEEVQVNTLIYAMGDGMLTISSARFDYPLLTVRNKTQSRPSSMLTS